MPSRAGMLLLGCLALSACSRGPDHWFGFVHRIDIQQGNVIEQELINRIERGMSKAEVRDALGTPLLIDPFHPDQWVYVQTLQQGEEYVQHNLFLHFDNDALVLVEGNVAGRVGPPGPTGESPPRAVRVPDPPSKGLLSRLFNLFDDTPARRPTSDPDRVTKSGPAAAGEEIVPENPQQ